MSINKDEQEKIPFEARIERLQSIIGELEKGSIALEEGLALYKEGLEHAKASQLLIENAQHEIKILEEKSLKDFTPID